MGVAIDGFLMNVVAVADGMGATPVEELLFDGVAFGVIANGALTAVAIGIGGSGFVRAGLCYQVVHRSY